MTNTKKILIGKVYANWCGHCVSLKPEWQKMKNHIKKNYKHIEFIEAEVSQINKVKNIKERHNIQVNGYPTIFKIKENGQLEYYSGPRFSNDLIQWATESNKKYMGGKTKSQKKTHSYKRKRSTTMKRR